ncbi:molybdopterin-dependent oxidoreductase [Candidatus Poribacteria bacterium]|nr:molybdopterin-dependent oxidoreductase [Candidatus Poribacteria bacterium]
MTDNLKKVPVGCPHDCGGSCLLIAHVEDGVVKRITTDESLPDNPGVAQLRACLKGRAYRQRLYHPDRLKHPLKRVGERGSGKFEQISWDEALDAVAENMLKIRDKHGPTAIMNISHSGSMLCSYHGKGCIYRLLNMFGGQTMLHSIVSNEGGVFAALHTYGTVFTTSEREDLLNSKMIIIWGWNPTDSVWGTNSSYYLALAREKGARIVAVDPRYTDTGATFADQWIPIRPGTDTAMLVAMAYVMIEEGLYDKNFLDKYTLGFDKFKEYVTGREDDVPKTPQWAEQITGVPAQTIVELAHAYSKTKPAALTVGHGPGRTNHGEQFHRAAATLCAMTGNVGVSGGDTGVSIFGYPIQTKVMSFPAGGSPENVSVHFNKWADAIIEGRTGGYPSDIKMVYSVAGNTVNQLGNVRKADRALKMLDFMVAHDHFLTATARYADIVLPATTHFERSDVMSPWCFGHYIIWSEKAIEPYGECRNDIDICADIAKRLGIQSYNDTPEDEWLKYLTGSADISDWDEFQRRGFLKYKLERSHVAFREQVEDFENNPFGTPSGKMEIYSQSIADMGKPDVPPIPKYVPPSNQEADDGGFPLRLITAHSKKSCNSMFYNLPWVREAEAQEIWINSADAGPRGIKNGDMVKVTNGIGATVLPARVTERIVPGTVNIDQGMQFEFDSTGVETKGCANAVCPDVHTSIDITPYNSTRVQVARA